MKLLLISVLLFLFSCRSGIQSDIKKDDFVQMNDFWQTKPHREKIVKYFGPHYKEIEEGILYNYNYNNSGFTKMAFFFDKNKKLVDQFAIAGKEMLNNFKNRVPCKWAEKKTQLRGRHAVKTVESGECPEQHVKFFFRQDLGLYEIRWY